MRARNMLRQEGMEENNFRAQYSGPGQTNPADGTCCYDAEEMPQSSTTTTTPNHFHSWYLVIIRKTTQRRSGTFLSLYTLHIDAKIVGSQGQSGRCR